MRVEAREPCQPLLPARRPSPRGQDAAFAHAKTDAVSVALAPPGQRDPVAVFQVHPASALFQLEALTAITRLSARGVLGTDPVLPVDYRFLQRASLRLRLLRDRADDWLAPGDLLLLARSLDLGEAQLSEHLKMRMARVRRAFSRALG